MATFINIRASAFLSLTPQAEEQRLQLEYLAYQEQEAGRQGQRVREVGVREEEAKRNVGQNLRKRRRAVEGKEVGVCMCICVYATLNEFSDKVYCACKEIKHFTPSPKARLVQHSMLRHKQLYTAFHKAEKEMVTALQARKAEVKVQPSAESFVNWVDGSSQP